MDRLIERLPDEERRPLWRRLPRRNLRRVLFLVIALLGVVVIKRSSGWRLGSLLDSIAPPPPAPAPSYRLRVESAPAPR